MESNRGDERCGRHTQRAYHMRRGQQPGMHRTPHTTHDTHSNPRQQKHTHHTRSSAATPTHTDGRGRSKQERHTRPHRMHIRRERSVVSAPLTEGTHTQEEVQCPQQHKSKVTIKKERSPHTTWIVVPRDVQPIFITKTIQLSSAFVHIQRTPLHAGTANTAAAAAQPKMLAGNIIKQATIYLCFCLNVGRCLHAFFCFAEGKPSCLGRVLGIPAGYTIIFFFPLVNVACVGAANNSVCVVPASLCYSAATKNNLPGRWPNPEFPNNRNQTR
ncbi:hypothetical protein ECC02_009929 [Trypanosoma cruzi]|uniref:Uncharacterized protein n=1 Tax=Trypanosoma cruzi TaxID=5693 RepID=A0A7J6XSH4_TRYCR|nr:hypothetical protein ECC02_009929 [Trypanosoma cruzi]